MPDVKGPGKNPSDSSRFMRETIVKQSKSKGQMLKKALALIFAAVIFGLIACVTFVLVMPWAESRFGKPEETVPILIPKDTEATTQIPEPTEESINKEPIEDIVQTAIEENRLDIEDFTILYGNLRNVSQTADKGIVTITAMTQGVDWFDNTVENSGQSAGAIIAITDTEIVILTTGNSVTSADAIRVTFSDETQVTAAIKQSDKVMGMTIISVPIAEISAQTLEYIKPMVLGNSYSVKQGDPVIAVGSPAGMVHSTTYGFVSYIRRNAQIADGSARVFYSDLNAAGTSGTMLLNMSGEIIGIVTEDFKSDATAHMNVALAISDFKGVLEKITNGTALAYFGIKGQEITRDRSEASGLPIGIYVSEATLEAPAYTAGIQSGDIVTKLNDKEVTTLKELQSQIENHNSGDLIKVTVQRKGRDEYKEIEFQVTLGIR